MAQRHYSLFFK